MNKIKLAALSFGILFGSTVFAQQQNQISKKNQLSKEERMEMRQDNFSNDLNLTKEQQEKMNVLRESTMKERERLKNDSSLDGPRRGEAMKALNLKHKQEMSKILSDEQATQLHSNKINRSSHYGKKHSNKKHLNKKIKNQRKGGKKYNKNRNVNANLAPVKD
ncbi:MAG TPA: hypothetical protein VLY84_03635 [Dysgonamonadaceae bacterium]|nr:hypothetical protein [Dysgonamonadaceae bacterium]